MADCKSSVLALYTGAGLRAGGARESAPTRAGPPAPVRPPAVQPVPVPERSRGEKEERFLLVPAEGAAGSAREADPEVLTRGGGRPPFLLPPFPPPPPRVR